jgi:hypothetical protein
LIFVILPSDELLNQINRKMIFLKAYQLAVSEGRLSFSVATSLIMEAKEALNFSPSANNKNHSNDENDIHKKYNLLESLDNEVNQCIEKLENLLSDTTAQLKAMGLPEVISPR